MTNVIVGFSAPKRFGILSWLIRKVERTKFSHVYFRFMDEEANRSVIYQASGLKVNCIGEIAFNKVEIIIDEFYIECPKEQLNILKGRVIDRLGKPYAWKQLFGIGWMRLASLFGKRVTNPFADGNGAYICAEFVDEDLRDLFLIDLGVPLDNVTPKDIYDALIRACVPQQPSLV